MAGTEEWREVCHDVDTDWCYICRVSGNGESRSQWIPSVARISAVAAPNRKLKPIKFA